MSRIIKKIFLAAAATLAALVITFFVLVAWPLPTPLAPKLTPGPLVLSNINVIDMETGHAISEQTVIIEDDRITSIGSQSSVSVPGSARHLDGTGKYLIPALSDMHTHQGSELSPYLTMPLFIAAGVTNIRDLGGDAGVEQKKNWHKQVDAGELLGPRIRAQAGTFVTRLANPDDAAKIVNAIVDPETDFIKVFNAPLPTAFFELLDQASKKGISVLGHKPRAVRAIDAANMGFKSFEHARLFLFECYPGASALRERYQLRYTGKDTLSGRIETTAMRREMIDNHDPELFDELVAAMVNNGTWFCPTHITRKMDAFADDEAYRNDSRLKYIHFLKRLGWKLDADGMIDRDPTPEGRQAFMDFYRKGLELTGKAHHAGVKILAGTDANDSYCFPGLSIHDELQELVKAGLTPLEALRTATINPAAYFGFSSDYGSIAIGKVADLIILDADPLAAISNTAKINTVIMNGNVFTRDDLDQMLNFVEQNARSISIACKLIWREIGG